MSINLHFGKPGAAEDLEGRVQRRHYTL
jgi:hypothetical protein